MKKTNKVTLPKIEDAFDVEDVVGQIRRITIDRNDLVSAADTERQRIDTEYGPRIAALNDQLTQLTEQLAGWAGKNPDFFDGEKSFTTAHGRIGWRLGNWQTSAIKGWIWARTEKSAKHAKVIVEHVGRVLGRKFLRPRVEVDREAIIAARDQFTPTQLQAVGIQIHQQEHFYVEPNVEIPGSRQTASV